MTPQKELQDALFLLHDKSAPSCTDEDFRAAEKIQAEAARLVADLNIEQIAQRLHNQRIRGVKCYESFPEECTCMADAEAVVAAALTPTGAPNG